MALRDKTRFQQSATATFRERPPTSPEIASRGNVTMTVDFSQQQPMLPKTLGGAHTRGGRTTNRSGKPKALNVMIGGAPDTPSLGPRGPRRNYGPVTGK